jgi:hypothetical protein
VAECDDEAECGVVWHLNVWRFIVRCLVKCGVAECGVAECGVAECGVAECGVAEWEWEIATNVANICMSLALFRTPSHCARIRLFVVIPVNPVIVVPFVVHHPMFAWKDVYPNILAHPVANPRRRHRRHKMKFRFFCGSPAQASKGVRRTCLRKHASCSC